MGEGTELGRVRGLGSAKEGAHHWLRQRVTAGSNLFLMAWFFISLTRLSGYDYGSIHDWMRSAWVAIPMILLVLSVCSHARLGLQVVAEDYSQDEERVVLLVLMEYFLVVVAVVAVFSILRIALGAA